MRRPLGFDFKIFVPQDNSPAERTAAGATVAGYDDLDAVEAFARGCDVRGDVCGGCVMCGWGPVRRWRVVLCKRARLSLAEEVIEVDEKILTAGFHHGSTYFEHQAFLRALKNKLAPEVSGASLFFSARRKA